MGAKLFRRVVFHNNKGGTLCDVLKVALLQFSTELLKVALYSKVTLHIGAPCIWGRNCSGGLFSITIRGVCDVLKVALLQFSTE